MSYSCISGHDLRRFYKCLDFDSQILQKERKNANKFIDKSCKEKRFLYILDILNPKFSNKALPSDFVLSLNSDVQLTQDRY